MISNLLVLATLSTASDNQKFSFELYSNVLVADQICVVKPDPKLVSSLAKEAVKASADYKTGLTTIDKAGSRERFIETVSVRVNQIHFDLMAKEGVGSFCQRMEIVLGLRGLK